MEKYEDFSCKLSGVNPFVQPRYRRFTAFSVFIIIARSPILFLFMLKNKCVQYLLQIKIKDPKLRNQIICDENYAIKNEIHANQKKTILLNSVSFFDNAVAKFLFKGKANIVFPERCQSNGKAFMKMRSHPCDYVCHLEYENEAVFLYGGYFEFMLKVLAFRPKLNVRIIESKNFEGFKKITKIPFTNFDEKNREEFFRKFALKRRFF